MNAAFQNLEIVGESPGDRGEAKFDELLQDRLQIHAFRPSHRRARNRNQAGKIDGKIVLERGVLEQIGHGQMWVGLLLGFQRNSDIGGRFITDVQQLRNLAGHN